MTKDEALFLVERYGYARRDGEHQGKKSAEWMAEVGAAIDACVAEALADPLALLEALAREVGTAVAEITTVDALAVVFVEGELSYWHRRPDIRLEITRDEAQAALLAGKGDER